MKIFQRYAFFQTLKIFFIWLAAITLGFLFVLVVKTSIDHGAPILLTLKLTPYMLPDLLSKTFPLAALLSVCIFFSRMAGNNEIIALKALGVAPWRILFPVWVFMFFISLTSVWLNDLSLSWSREKMRDTFLQEFGNTLHAQLSAKKRFATPDGDFSIEVSDVVSTVGENGKVDRLLISPIFTGKGGKFIGVADSARLKIDKEANRFYVKLYDADIDVNGYESKLPREYELERPLNEICNSQFRVDPSAAKAKEALANLAAEREGNRRRLASTAIFAFLRGDLRETSHPVWKERIANEKRIADRENRYRLIVPRVWASGFSSFFFVWVGAPFAIWFNKGDLTAAFFACFLPILGLYYPLFMFGLEGAKSGTVPPFFAWTGNVVLAVVGCYFLKKIH